MQLLEAQEQNGLGPVKHSLLLLVSRRAHREQRDRSRCGENPVPPRPVPYHSAIDRALVKISSHPSPTPKVVIRSRFQPRGPASRLFPAVPTASNVLASAAASVAIPPPRRTSLPPPLPQWPSRTSLPPPCLRRCLSGRPCLRHDAVVRRDVARDGVADHPGEVRGIV